jgi:hypothetical protein
MDHRQEQVAKNEARHRELNEEIEESYESHPGHDFMDVVCECGIAACDVFPKVTRPSTNTFEPMLGSSSSSANI